MTTVCPQDTCRTENPDSARFCLRCATRFDVGESPPTENPTKYDFTESLERDKEAPAWKVIGGIGLALALLVAGVVVVNANRSEAYDPQANVQEIAEVINVAHRNGCRIFISVGASSDETDATLTKNAKKEADGVRGAEVAAYDVGPASPGETVRDATGEPKPARFIATVAALSCDES